MDTKPLERFATQARRDLLSSVDARATAVLAPGSVAHAERPEVVRKLEAEITALGRDHVIDKVAYTWFNRIIALRFMDARGYTDAGIVSPAQGQSRGQPEILADAKRGNLDTEVVINKTTAEAILSLLNGSRRSTDAEGEAYALLLTEYCRHWHKSMPFMFEREGDYAELLVPTGLLADGAILSQARQALTEEVCGDVEVIGWLYQFYISERKGEVFAGFKKNKKAGADEIPAATQLFTPHWIVRYLVENSLGRLWLLNRPSSDLADRMDYYVAPADEEADLLRIAGPEELTVVDPACGSGHMLTYAFDLLHAIYEEEGYAPAEIPSLILTHNLHGAEIDPRAGELAAFALTMKARARQRGFFNKHVVPNVCVIEPISFDPDELDLLATSSGDRQAEEAFWNQFQQADTLGSLLRPDAGLRLQLANHVATLEAGEDLLMAGTVEQAQNVLAQAEYLASSYAILVANPPYMDARNMGATLYEYVAEQFPAGSSGIDLAFSLRARELVRPGGYLGLLSMDSWLGNAECTDFRAIIREHMAPMIVLHLGSRAFPEIKGEVVQVAATVFRNAAPRLSSTMFIEANTGAGESSKTMQFFDARRRHKRRLDWFDAFPGRVFTAYAASDSARETFASAPGMTSVANVRTGLQTGDNNRFLRHWFEVSASRIRDDAGSGAECWVPYVKSSTATRWFAREDFVVNWEHDGAQIRAHKSSVVRNSSYYMQPGLSYGGLAGKLKVRLVDRGAIFDQKNSMVFPVGATSPLQLLALMNSAAFESLARLVSPKGFGVGALAKLPIPEGVLDHPRVEDICQRAVELTRRRFDRSETSRGFVGLESILLNEANSSDLRRMVNLATRAEEKDLIELAELARENDEIFQVALLSGSRASRTSEVDSRAGNTAVGAIARDLVSYAVGCMFGRFSLDEPGLIIADQGASIQNYFTKVQSPVFPPDPDNVIPFVDDGWFEDDIVERFRQFLRAAFGEESLEKNLRFIEEALDVKSLRDYFITRSGKSRFYEDHVQRYKRPIYWMFSSPKGSFNALIYMHRYNPSTVSTVLNEYLREYRAKLEVARAHADQAGAAGSVKDQKEADRLRNVLAELSDYEHDVLYPLATQQIVIDLDDGVKANFTKFYPALRKIAGLEAAE
jgi:hypothetical protein